MRGTYTKVSPLGPQSVKMTLPAGTKVSKIQLLVAGTEVPFTRTGNSIAFTVPRLANYEVAAVI